MQNPNEFIPDPLPLPLVEPSSGAHPVRLEYVELMRAIAILMVVAIHVAATYFYNSEVAAEATKNWTASAWVMGFLRSAVPLFFMISGALLLQPSKASETIRHFFRKRITRVFTPFAIWSAAFIGWRIVFLNETLSLSDAVAAFFQGKVYVHFWFMYVLLALYFVTPCFRQFTRNASQTQLAYALVIWFLVESLLPLMQSWWGFEFNFVYHIPLSKHIGFFLGGYYLSRVNVSKQVHRLLPSLYIAVALFTGALTIYLNGSGSEINDAAYDNLQPNTICMAVCLFLWLKDLSYLRWASHHFFLNSCVKLLSRFSFGIYLMHLMLVDLFQSTLVLGLQINALPLSPFLTIPLFSVIIVVLSVIFLALISRLPGGKLISP